MTNQTQYFTGSYVNDVRDLYVASLVTGWHSLVVGAPGWGKTDIALSLLTDVYGSDAFLFLRLHEAILPNRLEGSTDMDHLLQKSEFRLNRTGTPYDPKYQAMLLDEMGRGNDVAYGLLMDVLDRKDTTTLMPVLATANFLPVGKKYEGLLDRFALWHWVSPGSLDARAVALAQASRRESDPMLTVPGRLPTVAELDFCHTALPGPDALNALGDTIDLIGAEMVKEGKLLHPRRIAMFTKILLRMSYYLTGTNNFTKVPVDAIRNQAAVVVNEAASKKSSTDDEKLGYTKKLMQFDKSMKALLEQFPGNTQVLAARAEIKGWYSNITNGETVERI